MADSSTLLYVLIVGCEAAFWVVLGASLVARYLWRRERLSRWLLFGLPLIDVLLLLFAALDLKAGATATTAHGLAAVYVGFTVMFGALAIRWADARFAHRFASGPVPARAPTVGWALVRYDLVLWARSVGAWVIALALIGAVIALLGDGPRTEPLEQWYRIAFGSVVLWFVFGPLWSLATFRRA